MFGYIRYSWQRLKSRLKLCILLALICSAFTILLGLFEGVLLGQWFLQNSHETAELLVQDTVSARAYSWFSVPGRPGFLDAMIQPYYIQQLRNPIDWVDKLGLKRPTDWDTRRVGQLASLSDLYRRRRRYSDAPPWHYWIYASAQSRPMEGDVDEWDKAFNELLQYQYKYELSGRANFHYVACPMNFLCKAWRITGPALLHFTTELPPQAEAADKSETKRPKTEIMPNHDPVTVRLFELPLRDPVLPGVFPSRFEQLRSITGNLSFWSSEEPYSEALQYYRQARKLYSSMATLHPRTYGVLFKVERYYLELLGLSESQALGRVQLLSIGVSMLSTMAAVRAWELVSTLWGALRGEKANVTVDGSQDATEPASQDPVAKMLQTFVDELTEEQEKSLMEDAMGSQIMSRIRTALDKNNFDSKNEVLDGTMNALGKGHDGKIRHSG